jgi:hypothetical protein
MPHQSNNDVIRFPQKGIQPFPESPSEERANKRQSSSPETDEKQNDGISAVDLFSLFTADVIRENLEFRR